jgi:hypothetical protein
MLLVVSLDSESPPWLEEHTECGRLPNLRQLMLNGARLPMEGPALAGTVYPTLYTGRRAADLGVYFPVQWAAEEQSVVPWDRFQTTPTIFERVDQTGRRMIVLDPPECRPVVLKHGVCVSGIQFRARVLLHSWSSDGRRLTPSPRADEVFGRPNERDLGRIRRALLGAPARLEAAALHAPRNESPDCLWVTCCGMHVAGHQFFNLELLGKSSSQRAELERTRLEVAPGVRPHAACRG